MGSAVHGDVAPGFEPVRDAFAELGEEGAGVCAYDAGGRVLLDLRSGLAGDQLVHAFSVTKPMAAFCVLVLWDRGLLELDAPLAPGGATVRQALAHQAGLVALREPRPTELLFDWEGVVAALEAEPPWWPPGERHGEHALFYGHLAGEVVRRVDGRSLGTFWREEVAQPWDLDFHIGLAAPEHGRVADLVDPDGGFRDRALDGASETKRLALENPPGLLDVAVLNGRGWRTAEIPAVNGHGTARAVARFHAALLRGGELDGVRLVREEAVAEMVHAQSIGRDALLGRDVMWGLGPMLDAGGFGMGGIGGSLGWADARRGYAFGYVTRTLGTHDRAEHVERALLDVLG